MTTPTAFRTVVTTLALFGLGCAGAAGGGRIGANGESEARNTGSAIVVQGEELQGRGVTLLAALDHRVSGLTVNYGPSCPEIQMRGVKSLFGSRDPLIYIDGARALDTCVLDDLATSVVKRVEVYPSGAARKPGYDSSRNGLILVFVLDGSEG
jgi:hypothetical protein